MLDIKKIRKDPDFYKQKLGTRAVKPEELDEIIELDAKRRELLQKSETLKAERNATSKKIGEAKKNHAPAEVVIKHMREIGG